MMQIRKFGGFRQRVETRDGRSYELRWEWGFAGMAQAVLFRKVEADRASVAVAAYFRQSFTEDDVLRVLPQKAVRDVLQDDVAAGGFSAVTREPDGGMMDLPSFVEGAPAPQEPLFATSRDGCDMRIVGNGMGQAVRDGHAVFASYMLPACTVLRCTGCGKEFLPHYRERQSTRACCPRCHAIGRIVVGGGDRYAKEGYYGIEFQNEAGTQVHEG